MNVSFCPTRIVFQSFNTQACVATQQIQGKPSHVAHYRLSLLATRPEGAPVVSRHRKHPLCLEIRQLSLPQTMEPNCFWRNIQADVVLLLELLDNIT